LTADDRRKSSACRTDNIEEWRAGRFPDVAKAGA